MCYTVSIKAEQTSFVRWSIPYLEFYNSWNICKVFYLKGATRFRPADVSAGACPSWEAWASPQTGYMSVLFAPTSFMGRSHHQNLWLWKGGQKWQKKLWTKRTLPIVKWKARTKDSEPFWIGTCLSAYSGLLSSFGWFLKSSSISLTYLTGNLTV